MNENDRNFTYSHEEAKAMTLKAVRMAARSLNISNAPAYFSWEDMAEGLITEWQINPLHYQLLVEMEDDVIKYAIDALLDWVELQALGE